ncbi:DUF423 domain-containing protein [Pseudaminobacter sp. NGMCC 1.201702]|uniref:DUF423 domain-containing protein n=1 Tax=Pseudaminobacter sp. NGMCC 1.201702 TaxID=3391825 RepID=UPI0039F01055
MGDRYLVLAGGLCGAAGVALSAAAAHRGGGNLATAASFLLVHAPAFLALAQLEAGRLVRIGAFALLIGLVLFAGDLLFREFLGTRLFPMAAPSGGTLMIVGWLIVAASAFRRR